MEVTVLSLGSIRSHAPYVLVSNSGRLVSEHQTATDAVESMASLHRIAGDGYVTVYKRNDCNWEKL